MFIVACFDRIHNSFFPAVLFSNAALIILEKTRQGYLAARQPTISSRILIASRLAAPV